MKETDKELWTQLFTDKPISQKDLDNFHGDLMTKILANPVDFGQEIRLAQRRKWGIGLVVSLIATGLLFGTFLWFKGDLIYDGVKLLFLMFSGLLSIFDLQQVWHQIQQDIITIQDLNTGLALLWGVLSWPILAGISVIIILKSFKEVGDGESSI